MPNRGGRPPGGWLEVRSGGSTLVQLLERVPQIVRSTRADMNFVVESTMLRTGIACGFCLRWKCPDGLIHTVSACMRLLKLPPVLNVLLEVCVWWWPVCIT